MPPLAHRTSGGGLQAVFDVQQFIVEVLNGRFRQFGVVGRCVQRADKAEQVGQSSSPEARVDKAGPRILNLH